MDLDNLNFLPEWEDDDFEDDEAEGWKKQEGRQAVKLLYEHWRDFFGLIIALADNLCGEEENTGSHEELIQKMIYENAMIIAPKLISAAHADMFMVQMENAAIIRTNARQLMEQIMFSEMMGFISSDYKKVMEEAMMEFKALFKNWVATFQKDEFEDDWGLFN